MLDRPLQLQKGEPLTRTAYYTRSSIDRLPQWLTLRASVQEGWRKRPWWHRWRRPLNLERTAEAGDLERRRLCVYRLKTLLLTVDTAALMLMIFRLVAWLPAWEAAVSAAVHAVFYTTATLAAVGLLVEIAGIVAWLARVQDLVTLLFDRYPYSRYLMLSQLAFLAGMQLGWILAEESAELIGMLSVNALLCAGICGVLTLALIPLSLILGGPTRSWNPRIMFFWMAFFFVISGIGLAMLLDETVKQALMLVLRICVWLTPLWAILFTARQAGWLLRPFHFRQLGSNELPRKVRASLAFLVLTAAVPLGGLAIPFWIYAYHRLWPRYRRYAGNNAGVLSANAAAPADS